MSGTTTLPATPTGWIIGTECGYPSHTGFVKGCVNGRDHWSLTPNSSGWVLARIVNRVAESSRTFPTLAKAVEYVG